MGDRCGDMYEMEHGGKVKMKSRKEQTEEIKKEEKHKNVKSHAEMMETKRASGICAAHSAAQS